MTPSETAVQLFHAGASCAQAVLGACAPSLGLDQATAMKLGSGMGAGLAGLRETCGAVTAMVAILGLRDGIDSPMDAKTKAALYERIRSAIAAFDAQFGTHNCKALLQKASIEKQAGVAPEARTAAYYAQRPCAAFVRFCAEWITQSVPQPPSP
ncbi:MAG: C_GCAxxG_C_C family protein [Kiritimatiellae bacterium]|nr:C_GCAxxG_C_C family protein [Kiritimatiellia bacterium]